jgi:hypothetical protein
VAPITYWQRRFLADAIRQPVAIEAATPIAKPLQTEEAIAAAKTSLLSSGEPPRNLRGLRRRKGKTYMPRSTKSRDGRNAKPV